MQTYDYKRVWLKKIKNTFQISSYCFFKEAIFAYKYNNSMLPIFSLEKYKISQQKVK